MPCSRNEYRRPRIVGPWRGEKVPMADGYSRFHIRLFGMRDRHCRRAGDVVLSCLCRAQSGAHASGHDGDGGQVRFASDSDRASALIPSPTSPAPTRTLRPELHPRSAPSCFPKCVKCLDGGRFTGRPGCKEDAAGARPVIAPAGSGRPGAALGLSTGSQLRNPLPRLRRLIWNIRRKIDPDRPPHRRQARRDRVCRVAPSR